MRKLEAQYYQSQLFKKKNEFWKQKDPKNFQREGHSRERERERKNYLQNSEGKEEFPT